jgi:hypothetical protein
MLDCTWCVRLREEARVPHSLGPEQLNQEELGKGKAWVQVIRHSCRGQVGSLLEECTVQGEV